jgi:hypothetical protein
MDCRQFRKQHAFFHDDMLSGVATWQMRDHIASCSSCARFDTQLRRSLLVARQAPTLELSRDFHRRLSAKLAAEKLARPAFREVEVRPRKRWMPAFAAALAAVAIGAAGLGIYGPSGADSLVTEAPPLTASMVPADTSVPDVRTSATPSPQPVHPAMLLAQRAAEQLAASQARTGAVRATH